LIKGKERTVTRWASRLKEAAVQPPPSKSFWRSSHNRQLELLSRRCWAEESRPRPSTTARTEEPVAAQAAEEALAEAGLVDIASILGAPTVTVVRSSL
jgi:hypothetical protein